MRGTIYIPNAAKKRILSRETGVIEASTNRFSSRIVTSSKYWAVHVITEPVYLYRSRLHLIKLVSDFNHIGVHFHSLDLGVDSTTPAGKMVLQIFAALLNMTGKAFWKKHVPPVYGLRLKANTLDGQKA